MRIMLLLSAFILGSAPAFAGLDNILTVKTIQGQQATLEGKTSSLKAGDKIYFARSPYQFPVNAVAGNTVTINLPTGSDVGVGQTMMLQPSDAVKKAINTEDKLKKALED